MKRTHLIVFATAAALSFAPLTLVGCGQQGGTTSSGSETAQEESEPQYADDAFMKDLAKGLEARWKLSNELTYTTTQEEEKVMRQLVNAELDVIKDYTGATFENSKLQEKAIQYINLLKDQLESLKYIQVDYNKYNEMWTESYNARSKMLVDFTDNFGLTVSDEYAETLTDMKVNASLVAEKESKQAAIDALTDGIVFEKASDDPYDWTYSAIVENNTGFDIKTYNADVTLLDADGINVGTGNIYVTSWKNGQKAKLEFYSNGQDFASTEVNVTYWE